MEGKWSFMERLKGRKYNFALGVQMYLQTEPRRKIQLYLFYKGSKISSRVYTNAIHSELEIENT